MVVRQREHINEALARHDGDAARASMRLHLINMQQRVQGVVESTAQ